MQMKFKSLYLDIFTGSPDGNENRYMAPNDGRTANYVVNPEIDGRLVGVWHSFTTDFFGINAFSTIDVIPYQYAKDNNLFESPQSEEMFPDRIDSLFILRLSSYPPEEDDEEEIRLQIKINIIYE